MERFPSDSEQGTHDTLPAITVRLTNSTYRLVKQAADHARTGITPYIREAALMQAWADHTARHNLDGTREELRDWLAEHDKK